jgi:hypothetical protein
MAGLLRRRRYASLTGFSSVPSPVISSLQTSPGWSVTGGFRENPAVGVPVEMRSPGERLDVGQVLDDVAEIEDEALVFCFCIAW